MRLQTNDMSLRAAGFGPPPRVPRKRLKAHQARALIRLRELGALNLWRAANGILLLNYRTFVRVIIDALAHVGDASRRCVCVADVRAALPRDVADEISDVEILRHISTVLLGSRMLVASDAGQLVELVELERRELEREGVVFRTLNPRDETHFARSQRRAERRRMKARERMTEYRKKLKNKGANCVTNPDVTSASKVTLLVTPHSSEKEASRADVTFKLSGIPGAVVAALARGADLSTSELIHATGGNAAAVKVALGRLVKRGLVVRVGRGLYRAQAP